MHVDTEAASRPDNGLSAVRGRWKRAGRFLCCREIAWPFVISRLAVIGLSMVLGFIPGLVRQTPAGLSPYMRLFAVWDGSWYVRIAQSGYHAHFDRFPDYVWFPLYPMLIRGFSVLTGGNFLIAAVIVSNLCLALAMIFVYRYTELIMGARIARRSILYLSLFPLTFVFSIAYPASLTLLLVVVAFYFAETEHWTTAGVTGMFAALTNPLGFLICLPLFCLYLRKRGLFRRGSLVARLRRIDTRLLWLGLIPAGLLAYYSYLYFLTGNFWADVGGESRFGRTPGPFWDTIDASLHQAFSHGSVLAVTDLVFITMYGGLLTFMLLKRKIRVEHILLAALFVIIPLSTGQSDGIGRYGMAAFPFFWALALLGERRVFHRAYLVLAPAALLALLVLVGTPMFVP